MNTASVTQATLSEELFVQQVATAMRNEEGARNYFATQRQQRIARTVGRNRKSVEGLGQPVAELDNDVYMFYVMKYGRQIWKQKDFLRWFQNRHPETRVEATGTRIQSGYGGLSAGKGKRFSKTYDL